MTPQAAGQVNLTIWYYKTMDFLKVKRRRKSLTSNILYIGLNLSIPLLVFVLLRTTGSIILPMLLVVLSKWRVLAVRPRYWLVNIQANLVDLIVGLSIVTSMALVNTANAPEIQVVLFQLLLVVFYAVWLLVIKPRSKRSFVVVQAGIALFLGTATTFVAISHLVPSFVVVLIMWTLGYLVARHTLSSYDEKQITLLSFTWGFFAAEIAWLAYHWTIAYPLPGLPFVQIPQVAILISLYGFVSVTFYNSFYKHKKIRLNDVLLPTIFSVLVTIVLLIFFDNITYLQ